MPSNQPSATRRKYVIDYNLIPSVKAMENHPCKKFPQDNYNGEDTLHSNRRRSLSSMALEDEVYHYLK